MSWTDESIHEHEGEPSEEWKFGHFAASSWSRRRAHERLLRESQLLSTLCGLTCFLRPIEIR